MVAAGNMDQFINTLAFVQGHEKNYVIQKVCTANQLRGCWQYDYVTLKDGKQWNIADTISGNQFRMTKDDNNDYTGQTVGIVNGDGTTMIISYNTKCATFDPAKTYPYSGVTNATTGCVAIVFDANGSRKPNTVGKDVVLFHANGLGRSCAFEVNKKCFGTPFVANAITKSECNLLIGGNLGIKGCLPDTDYWAGAVKACGGISKMPTQSDLNSLAQYLYDDKTITSNNTSNLTLNSSKTTSIGISATPFSIWTGSEIDNGGAYTRYIGLTQSFYYGFGYRGTSSKILTMCLIE